MNKVAHYLQEHLLGEVVASDDARRYFSTDNSIFTVTPSIIVYPRGENDVRKTARFTWQLAERNRIIPITPRGFGTDVSGGAIGNGILLIFPAHMNKIVELDSKSGEVTVEPGASFDKLQQALHTHGRFLPTYPRSLQTTTIGAAIANNSTGEKSVKYGSIKNFVKSLKVVLSNGEVLESKRLNKREFSKKMGLSSFEGEIYRAIDSLIEENHDLINKSILGSSLNAAGYDLASVKKKDGSFDLTPLFVGSQGTLGIITEATLDTERYSPSSTLVIASCDEINQAESIVGELLEMKTPPSTIEMIDRNLLEFVHKNNPNLIKDLVHQPFPGLVLLVEFDDQSERAREKLAKKAKKIIENAGGNCRLETDSEAIGEAWKIRDLSSAIVGFSEGTKRSLPIIEDGVVPFENLSVFMNGIYEIFKKNNLAPALWGQAGTANLHAYPMLDINGLGDRQKLFRIIDDYYNLVISLGGSINAGSGDGRLRGPYLEKLYGADVYDLFVKLKKIFDPYGIMNSGVKLDVTLENVKPLLRTEYSLDRQHDYMPRS